MKNRYRASHRLHLIHTQYYYKNAIGSGYLLYLLLPKAPQKDVNYHSFRRSFSLHQDMVIGDKIEAKYDNGILYISIPKSERAKVKPARRIHVK